MHATVHHPPTVGSMRRVLLAFIAALSLIAGFFCVGQPASAGVKTGPWVQGNLEFADPNDTEAILDLWVATDENGLIEACDVNGQLDSSFDLGTLGEPTINYNVSTVVCFPGCPSGDSPGRLSADSPGCPSSSPSAGRCLGVGVWGVFGDDVSWPPALCSSGWLTAWAEALWSGPFLDGC